MRIMIKNSRGSIFFSLHWTIVLPVLILASKAASSMLAVLPMLF